MGAGKPRVLSFFHKLAHQAALQARGNPAKAAIAKYTFKRISAWYCTPWRLLIIKEEMALLNASHTFSGRTMTLLLQLFLLLGRI